MKRTYLREAAREVEMDAGQLSKLADKFQVPIDDKDALMALGIEHQRPRESDDDEIDDEAALQADLERALRPMFRKQASYERLGIKVVQELAKEAIFLRRVLIDVIAPLEPVLGTPRNSPGGVTLTAEQAQAIHEFFGENYKATRTHLQKGITDTENLLKGCQRVLVTLKQKNSL